MKDTWLKYLLTNPIYNIKSVDKIIEPQTKLLVLVNSSQPITESEMQFIDTILVAAKIEQSEVQKLNCTSLPNNLVGATKNNLTKLMSFGFQQAPKIKYNNIANLHHFAVGSIPHIQAMDKQAKKKVWSQMKRFLLMGG